MIDEELRTNLNLLPSADRRRVLVRTGITLWGCVASVVLSVASLIVWRAERALGSVQEELSRVQRVHAPTQMMAGELETMRQTVIDLQSEEASAGELEDSRPTLALLGIISQAARACDGQLQVRECLLQRRGADRGRVAAEQYVLSIRGAALDVRYITRFHAALSDSSMFSRLEIPTITNEQIGNMTGHVFQIECAF